MSKTETGSGARVYSGKTNIEYGLPIGRCVSVFQTSKIISHFMYLGRRKEVGGLVVSQLAA